MDHLKFTDAKDVYMLEDESGRITLDLKLIGRENFPCFTGVIVAILGAESASGEFLVKEYCLADYPSPAPWSLQTVSQPLPVTQEDPSFIAFLSAPNISVADEISALRFSMALENLMHQVPNSYVSLTFLSFLLETISN